jgi:hypothetical protein
MIEDEISDESYYKMHCKCVVSKEFHCELVLMGFFHGRTVFMNTKENPFRTRHYKVTRELTYFDYVT